MEWLRNLDWGAISTALISLAFLYLVFRAVKRLGKGRDYGRDDDRPTKLPAAEKPARERKPKPKARKTRQPTKEISEAEEEEAPPPAPVDTAEAQQRLNRGLARTRGGFVSRLGQVFRSKSGIDETVLAQVEEILFTADIGVRTANELIESIRKDLKQDKHAEPQKVWRQLKQRSLELISGSDSFPLTPGKTRPFVLLVVGVNGTGKTTTIGKLAARLGREGHSVLLAAGDTFRAAASDQLAVWAERSGATIVRGKEGADPTSVIVDALKQAQRDGHDVVIADTAGRLHTKVSLMEELQKVQRSIGKHVPGAPHETFLVLDATTGQNAIAQAQMFKEATNVTGIVLTKLDGTAKGGVLLGICNELALPVRYIGIGEQVDDLRDFQPEAFVEALYAEVNPSH